MEKIEFKKHNSEHIRNIPLDIILTILTCYLYNFYVQYKQIRAVNSMLGEEKYSFSSWLILTLITCGLYHLYHEYRKSEDLCKILNRPNSNDALAALLLSSIGLPLVADAIQQAEINKYYGDSSL